MPPLQGAWMVSGCLLDQARSSGMISTSTMSGDYARAVHDADQQSDASSKNGGNNNSESKQIIAAEHLCRAGWTWQQIPGRLALHADWPRASARASRCLICSRSEPDHCVVDHQGRRVEALGRRAVSSSI